MNAEKEVYELRREVARLENKVADLVRKLRDRDYRIAQFYRGVCKLELLVKKEVKD